ncbi:hypothetical protein FOA52_003174 [Chlamydomonas sp. UWO 241]|nr:hypothetical protein FOA52_003174 [Chlamydomonas sp. UWO 241]
MSEPFSPPRPPQSPQSPPDSAAHLLEKTSLTTAVVGLLLVAWIILVKNVQSPYLTPGNLAALMGLTAGLLLLLFQRYVEEGVLQSLLVFDSSTFLVFLLPPVILNAGLRIPENFFSNLGTISCMGIGGTVISFAFIASVLYVFTPFHVLQLSDCLALGAIFSATDSVATLQVLSPNSMPLLFSLVFGEGVINDATSVVLLGAVSSVYPRAGSDAAAANGAQGGWSHGFGVLFSFVYLFTFSVVAGLAAGAAIVYLLRSMPGLTASQEMALVGMISYLSYLLADVAGLSGILSLFCCAICASHWALPRMSESGQTTTLVAFETLSHIAEGVIFLYVGMDALDPHKWSMTYPGEAIPMCVMLVFLLLTSRALAVVPMAMLHNLWGAVPLTPRDLVIIWWSGLMRGAVSVALVYFYFDASNDEHHATVITSTLLVVLFTTLAFGAATKPLLSLLLEERPDDPLTLLITERLLQLRGALERMPPPPPWLQRCCPCLRLSPPSLPRVYQQLSQVPLHGVAVTIRFRACTSS